MHASEVVTMDDPVEIALRKRRTLPCVAINQVKSNGRASCLVHACVSAGNTGALMAVARYLLKTVEGIDRPAIASVMPNQRDGYTTVSIWAPTLTARPKHLLQFAVMGSALVSAVDGKETHSRFAQHWRRSHQGQRSHQKRRGIVFRTAGGRGLINFYGNVEAMTFSRALPTSS